MNNSIGVDIFLMLCGAASMIFGIIGLIQDISI